MIGMSASRWALYKLLCVLCGHRDRERACWQAGCRLAGGSAVQAVTRVPGVAIRIEAFDVSGGHEVFWIELTTYVWLRDHKTSVTCAPEDDIRYVPRPFDRYQHSVAEVIRYDEPGSEGVCT